MDPNAAWRTLLDWDADDADRADAAAALIEWADNGGCLPNHADRAQLDNAAARVLGRVWNAR